MSAFDPQPTRNFAGLLRSCRDLYTEAAALLYSTNQFVFYAYKASLEPLQVLSPTAIASLTSLKIVLNESSCHSPVHSGDDTPFCCCDDVEHKPRADSIRAYCVKYHGSVHRRPLLDPVSSGMDSTSTSSKLAAQALLTSWHNAAVFLSSRVRPGRLALSLVCDINHQHEYALEAGQLATAPLALFPPLKDCHVRLCKQWDRPLQRLAEHAVLKACSELLLLRLVPAKAPSALVNLPCELRLLILEYTDLVTPWKEVTWCRRLRRYQVCRPPCLAPEGGCQPHIHHGCRLSQCLGVDPQSWTPSSPGCFCRRRHAAFSFTCNCWAPPTNLFLVCRALCRDAQLVFFSRNRFIVHDIQAWPFWEPDFPIEQDEPRDPETAGIEKPYPYERLAASHFLRDAVPVGYLAHLRFLELVFPPYWPHLWPVDDHPAILDWRDTVNWLRGKIDAPALTIRVVFADFLQNAAAVRQRTTKAEGKQIVRGYMHITQALKLLVKHDGLASLFVQAAFPWAWERNSSPEPYRPGGWWSERPVEEEQRLKEHLERIPGREAVIDSRNKPEPRKSPWQTWYDVNWC